MTGNAHSTAGPGLRLERQGAAAIGALGSGPLDLEAWSELRAEMTGWYPKLARDPGVYAAVVRYRGADGNGSACSATTTPPDLPEAARWQHIVGDELRLCWLHECFSKPTVGLLDGAVGAGQWRLVHFGTHRVGGGRFSLCLDGKDLGLLDSHGLAHGLARMPHAIGLYLVATGACLDRADAYALGLLTHCIDGDAFDAITAELADADPVDPLLDRRHRDPGVGPVLREADRIERYFGAPDGQETLRRLAAPHAGDEDWAAATLAAIRRRDPLSWALASRVVRAAGGLDLRQCLEQDYRVACRLPGLLDQAARRPDAVVEAQIGAVLTPLDSEALGLASREEMQARRV